LAQAKSLTITLEEGTFVALRAQADREQRSVAFLIRKAIDVAVAAEAEIRTKEFEARGGRVRK